jgi:sulfite reductase beta subunit-like hemoprotein
MKDFTLPNSLSDPVCKIEDLSRVEQLKRDSRGLRGTLAAELSDPSPAFSEPMTQILKFHGIYQQDNRDDRKRGPDGKMQKSYSLMVRGRIPGGRLKAGQYLKLDELAGLYGQGSLRLTTRQSVQFHGVLKSNAKELLTGIRDAVLSTIAACGDVVRNVTQAINPTKDPVLALLDPIADRISSHFEPQSGAYAEIWLDGEPVSFEETHEPIYGSQYLPRKFKIGVTIAGNNSIDLFTNDMGIAATLRDGAIDGFYFYAGGGLGKTHRNAETYPRLASPLGWVPEEALIPVASAIVTAQRDFGDRKDRKHARLKYLIEEQGVDWFRSEVERRSGYTFELREEPVWKNPEYLGWHTATDGTLSLGLHILAGRIKDFENRPLRRAIREAVERFQPDIQITPDQDLILTGISKEDKEDVESHFNGYGISLSPKGSLYHRALACPALPTCGLAITEAERFLPSVLVALQKPLDELGLPAPTIRMTGCPNGCARPYSAEIGLVGRSANLYALYLGGNTEGTRLASEITDSLKADQIEQAGRLLFTAWKQERLHAGESFGDFAHRKGVQAMQELISPLLDSKSDD